MGSSDAFPSAANTFSVVTNPEADSDGDGFPDGLEVEFGSDPLDPKSTPDFYSKGEAISLTFSLLNNAAPAPPQPDLREASSQLFSILNTVSLSSLTTDDSGKRSPQSATSDSSNTLGAPVSRVHVNMAAQLQSPLPPIHYNGLESSLKAGEPSVDAAD
jgi:Bacterial TSP3 repeat